MTSTAGLSARQRSAGQPLFIRELHRDPTLADYAAWDSIGIGAKVGSSPPSNTSELAGKLSPRDGPSHPVREQHNWVSASGDNTEVVHFLDVRRTVVLDANYVAGRYVFAFAAAEDGAILAASDPHLII